MRKEANSILEGEDSRPVVPVRLGMTLADAENLLITATLRWTGGNIKKAACILGIDRSTLYEKIKRYSIR
jgi:DNA-binding protein Fis